MTAKQTLLITFDKPKNVRISSLRDYIIDALESSGGNRHPDDEFFDSLQNVHVSKPIILWRDPAKPKKYPANVTPIRSRQKS